MISPTSLLSKCGGIEIESTYGGHQGRHYLIQIFHLVNNIVVPDDVYIKIKATSTIGTIGKLVDIKLYKNSYNDIVSPNNMTYIIQVEGRKETNRIAQCHAKILEDHDGTTKWVRNVKKHNKEEIPPHVNKYKQTLHKDEWVAGLGPGKVLYFGQVTRWSKSSIWVNPTPSLNKSKENCISYVKETLVLPAGIDYEQMVTIMALSGWKR